VSITAHILHQPTCDVRRRNGFGDHSDAAKRISDTYRLHRTAQGPAAIGQFFACALADGQTDGMLYGSKRDAVRHQHHNEQRYMFLAIGPYDLGPCDAEELLAIQRLYYDRGIRWPDPDHAHGGPEVIQRATVEDQRSLVRSIARGGRSRPSGLVYPGE
jgi:hypothetical protein